MKMVDTAVVALAGRRIDLPDAQVPQFPLGNVQEVGRRIYEALCEMHAVALVCSAACGADLVALEQAKQLGLRRRVVLPFAPERFRETSVVDRPGDWGPLYDQQVAATAAAGDLLVLDGCYRRRRRLCGCKRGDCSRSASARAHRAAGSSAPFDRDIGLGGSTTSGKRRDRQIPRSDQTRRLRGTIHLDIGSLNKLQAQTLPH